MLGALTFASGGSFSYTQNTMSGHNHVLPPATTTKVNLQAQAAGFFAQRRRGANVHEADAKPKKVHKATQGLYDDPEPVIIAEARQMAPTPPQLPETSEQRYTLAQLVEKIQQRRGKRKAVMESGDPDGPDDSGWDPGSVKSSKRGASLAAGVMAYQRRQQR